MLLQSPFAAPEPPFFSTQLTPAESLPSSLQRLRHGRALFCLSDDPMPLSEESGNADRATEGYSGTSPQLPAVTVGSGILLASLETPAPAQTDTPRTANADSTGSGGNFTVISSPPVLPDPATQIPLPPVDTQAAPADSLLTPEIVATRRTAAEQIPDLTEEIKSQIGKSFQRALESLTLKADVDKRAAELKAEKENGPARIAEQRALLDQPLPKAEPEFPSGATVAELDQLRLADEEKAADARRSLETWEAKAKIRAERRPQMPALIETTRKQLADAEKAAASTGPESGIPALGTARKTEQEALVLLLRSQLELYRIEQVRYEALNELFPLQRDVFTRARNLTEKRTELWKTVMADARRAESAQQAAEAKRKLRNAHPTLRDLAEKNTTLTARRKELQDFLNARVKELSEVNATLATVETKFNNVIKNEERAGLTTAIGFLLRSQRAHLPDSADYRFRQTEAEKDIVRLQTEQMPLDDERGDLGDIEAQTDFTLEMISVVNVPADELRAMTYELLSDRRHYLDDLLADYDKCLQTLGETHVACQRLETVICDFESYIDERVLWIRSAPALEIGFFRRTLTAAESFARHRQWPSLIRQMISDSQTYWPLYALFLVVFFVVLALDRTARKFVVQLGEKAEKQLDSGIPLALLSTAVTTVMAALWPAPLWFIGWRLSRLDLSLASALGEAFTFCAVALWIVGTFRTLCRKKGVTISFLEWPVAIARSLHVNLLWYAVVGIPLSFVVVAAGQLDDGASSETVARLAFVVFCLLLAFILRRLVRPGGQVIGNLLRSNPNSLMYRLRWVWYPCAVGSPLCLALLALMGYQYTAEQLMIRLQLTLGLSFVLVIAYTMVMQWMLAAKRSLAMRQARARRAAALAAAQRESEEDGGATSPIPQIETPQVDLSLLNQQMLRLLQGTAALLFLTISWGIWGQVLPALQVFSRVELWSVVVESTEQLETATDGPTLKVLSRVVWVTLGDLLLAVVVLLGSVLASRNLPGLLELAVLQRLPMDHGGRHAITTLCRYTFILTGAIIACKSVGVVWGSVQWLVAALTVGLGFGLQEIFANFISGLIILFERPVRIGDLVTIDGVSGCVSRIQIRATTITDWDRKEYIVPNKEFVTGKVLNWTLSDKVNRIVIEVGIAYGTDPVRALALLAQVADEHPVVLEDPSPVVVFDGFGESCLNLKLRCYLPNFEQRLNVISQLHVMVNERFKEAGIEIAFPQQDLHIRTVPPNFGVVAGMRSGPVSAGESFEIDADGSGKSIKRSA